MAGNGPAPSGTKASSFSDWSSARLNSISEMRAACARALKAKARAASFGIFKMEFSFSFAHDAGAHFVDDGLLARGGAAVRIAFGRLEQVEISVAVVPTDEHADGAVYAILPDVRSDVADGDA